MRTYVQGTHIHINTLDVGRIDVNVVRHQLWFRKAVSRLPMDASFRQPVLEILRGPRHVLLLLLYIYFVTKVVEGNDIGYSYKIILLVCVCVCVCVAAVSAVRKCECLCARVCACVL